MPRGARWMALPPQPRRRLHDRHRCRRLGAGAQARDLCLGELCYSACAFLWLGGAKLYANGVVSLHMPFYRTSMVTIAIPDEGVAAAAWYLASLGYDRSLMDAMLVVSSTESNEMFPVTGPNTALFHITYRELPDEGRYKEAMTAARRGWGSPLHHASRGPPPP